MNWPKWNGQTFTKWQEVIKMVGYINTIADLEAQKAEIEKLRTND